MKPMKFKTKKAALAAVDECQDNGWKAGIIGSGPWRIEAIHIGNGFRLTYELGEDGMMHEYSRKEVAA